MFDSIISSFQNLTPLLWASQICSIFGLIFLAISYQFKREKFYLIAGIASIFYMGENAFAGLYATAIVCAISFFKFILTYIWVKKGQDKLPDSWVYISLIIMALVIVVYMAITKTFNNWENYVPLVLTVIYSIMMNNKNYYIVKGGALVNEAGFLIFYIIEGLPVSIIREIILNTALIISVIKQIIKDNKNKNTTNDD